MLQSPGWTLVSILPTDKAEVVTRMEPGFCHSILMGPQVCTVVLDHTTWQACALQSWHLKAPQPKDWGFSSRAWTLALLDICAVFEASLWPWRQISLTPFYRQGTWFLKTLRSHTMNDRWFLIHRFSASRPCALLIYHLLLGVGSS